MADSGSGSSPNSASVPNGVNGGDGTEALKLLSQGWLQHVTIGKKAMLENIMHTLGSSVGPVFSVDDCGDDGLKICIKLDVSHLTTVNGGRIDHSIVRSEPTFNTAAGDSSAILKAFNHLENNYRIRIDDYSSRVVKKLESFDTFHTFEEAFGALHSLLVQWDLAMGSFENFSVKVREYEFSDQVRGPITPIGKVYGLLSEYFTDIHNDLHNKTKEIRSGIEEVELDRRHYNRRLATKGRLFCMNGPFNDVDLSSKFILSFVLGYYGLPCPEYVGSPDPSGSVKSTVVFNFPYMEGFHYGGKIEIEALGYSYVEAEEQAAFESLLFIEKHFLTKVVDFNFYQRKKEVKIQNTLVSMLSKTVELGDSLKMMFGEMINAVEGKIGQFSVDPDSFFVGPVAAGQIHAFKFCYNGLKDLDNYVVKCYGVCAPHFEMLHKLSWKLLLLQSTGSI